MHDRLSERFVTTSSSVWTRSHLPVFSIVLVAGLVLGVVAADDGPFYCGSKIIDVGMTQSVVLAYCGPPTSRSTDEQEVRGPNNLILGVNHVHRWKYESYSATRLLVFVEDKLQSIERW